MQSSRVESTQLRVLIDFVGCGLLEDVLVRFGLRLREVRQAAGISQEKLADLAGLHRTYVSSVERGLRNVSLVNIDKLARALKVSLANLMPTSDSVG